MNESLIDHFNQEKDTNNNQDNNQELSDSTQNPNYVKQSFDKLIYLYNNIEYQKFYLKEIEKPPESNFAESNSQNKENKILKKKKKRKTKNNKNFISNQEQNSDKNFCDSKCFEKFKFLINKFNQKDCLSDRNKKILEIIDFVTEKKNDEDKFNKLYEFIKNECK